MKPALLFLDQRIHLNDEEVLTDACWAHSYISAGPNDKIQAVIEAGVCPRLVELLLYVHIFSSLLYYDIDFNLRLTFIFLESVITRTSALWGG